MFSHFARVFLCVDYLLLNYYGRSFHASRNMLAWRRKGEDAPGLKAPRKEKHVRRETRTQAPVETPYVLPRQKPSAKSFHDKTVEIFEGMTILELAKRTGASIGSLQEIMKNVGEKVDSEFDPISVDVAELVAMVKFFCLMAFELSDSFAVYKTK